MAAAHFLGKSIEEAELLFREDSARYQEDLMWMGPRAYEYYVEAARRYAASAHAADDAEFVDALAEIVRFRQWEQRQPPPPPA